VCEVEAANAWIAEVYLPAHNARFARPAAVAESAFVPVGDPAVLAEALCRQEDRVVGRDNCVSFGRLKLQLPASPLRNHWVKANVRVHEYPDGTLALFYGPRRIARYTAGGAEVAEAPTAPSVTACSPPSRSGLARLKQTEESARRPSLTASARAVPTSVQVGTEKRPKARTKKPAGRGSQSASPPTI
jgi:hypothetical protein